MRKLTLAFRNFANAPKKAPERRISRSADFNESRHVPKGKTVRQLWETQIRFASLHSSAFQI
jgi:hypothetical protein